MPTPFGEFCLLGMRATLSAGTLNPIKHGPLLNINVAFSAITPKLHVYSQDSNNNNESGADLAEWSLKPRVFHRDGATENGLYQNLTFENLLSALLGHQTFATGPGRNDSPKKLDNNCMNNSHYHSIVLSTLTPYHAQNNRIIMLCLSCRRTQGDHPFRDTII